MISLCWARWNVGVVSCIKIELITACDSAALKPEPDYSFHLVTDYSIQAYKMFWSQKNVIKLNSVIF